MVLALSVMQLQKDRGWARVILKGSSLTCLEPRKTEITQEGVQSIHPTTHGSIHPFLDLSTYLHTYLAFYVVSPQRGFSIDTPLMWHVEPWSQCPKERLAEAA